MYARGPIAAAATLLAACTLTSGLSDYDADDAVDAGADVVGNTDAVGAPDTSAALDGGTDAAPTSACCAGKTALLCEDFEDNPQSRWTPSTLGATSYVALAQRPGGGTGSALESVVQAEEP